MLLDWDEFLPEVWQSVAKVAETSPDIVAGYQALHGAGAKTNHLGAKTRELICIAVAVTTRCDGCIANHVKKAVELGASREEIVEALGVAVAMNAGAALAYSGRAMDAYTAISNQ
jgi:AhpD family alkylhydroperoxidase